MKEMNILVVDDQEYNRTALIEGLIKHGVQKEKIFEVGSGEEAVELVRSRPGFFDVAVIDHKLKDGAIDGVETTKRICACERDIFPIIFTNVPTDNPQTIEIFRAKAYEAGAYRYMYRGGSKDGIKKVKDFVTEITQLRQLKERIQKFYEFQQYSPSLLTQLDIMVALIDRGFKVWYLNEANKKFQGLKGLPRSACSQVFLKFKNPPPCKGCIVHLTFQDGRNHERIYLHPDERSVQKIKWVYSWTQPMPDEKGNPILLEDGRPIAVLESCEDITDSNRLKTIPVKKKMKHIAMALNERYDGFDRIRIYEANPEGDSLTLIGYAGYSQKIGNARIEIKDFPVLQRSINHFKKFGEGKYHKIIDNPDSICPGELLENFIHWPLMKGERLLGLLSVSSVKNGRPCTEDGLDIVRDYGEEALKSFVSEGRGSRIPEIEKITSEIDNLIIREGTPESRLQILVDEAFRLTGSDSVHIRYRDGNEARLLPIGKGFYYKVAPGELPLSKRTTPAVRVIISGREEISGNATSVPEVMEFRQSLPEKAVKLLNDVDSLCFEPLIFQNHCIGSLALYKKEKNHYNNKRIALARVIAERMALILHDYLVSIDRMIKDYAFESSLNATIFTDLDGKINYVNESFLRLWGYHNKKDVLGKHIKEFWQYKNGTSELLGNLLIKGNWNGELVAKRKDGSTFEAQISSNFVKDKTGKAFGTMVSFIDISEQKRLENVQNAIYQISEAATSVQNLEKLYPKIYEIIGSLIPAKNFYIALYDEKKQVISFPYFIDQKENETPSPYKVGKGMTEYVLHTGEPILAPPEVVEDLANRGKIKIVGPLCIDWLGVPLKTKENKVIGVLAVQTYDEGLRYTNQDKDMLVFVSKQIAMAIERKQAEEQIIISLREKEVLLKEIHHRVKNNLAIIYELLDRQSSNIRDPEFLTSIESNKSRIKSMGLIHETLYQSDELSKIDSKLYIDNLANHLSLAYGKGEKSVEIKCLVGDINMNIENAIPCGLIINELVTNALKHAFMEGQEGEINIQLRSGDNNLITLMVSDNGRGLPGDVELTETPSLGLHLVNILSRQLEASVSIERDGGTRFVITFRDEE